MSDTFDRLRRSREVFRLLRANAPGYLRVLHYDVLQFRAEIIKTSCGLVVGAIGGMSFACFASLALLATAWDSWLRLWVAWTVCGCWAVISIAAFAYVRHALQSPVPFYNLVRLLQQDLAPIEKESP